MTAIVRTYNTGTNWNFTTFANTLETAFADVGFLSQDDRGICQWTYVSGTTLSSNASRSFLGLPIGCSLTNAIPPAWYLTRNSSGTVNTSSLGAATSGSGFKGRASHSGTWSQSGTTVTATIKKHGLTGTRQIYAVPTGTGASTGSYSATVVSEDQITYTVGTSGTFSGSITIYAFMGQYSQSGTTVTVTSPLHEVVNGSVLYANTLTGGLASQATGAVTVVDQNTFTFTVSTSATINGFINFNHTIRIDGSTIGGVTGTDDILVAVNKAGGICGSATTFSYRGSYGNDYVLWKMRADPTKVMGSQYLRLHWGTGTNALQMWQTPVWDLQAENYGSGTLITRSHESYNHTSIAINSGTSNNLTIKTFQSNLDPDFVVFTFRQANVFRGVIIFHKFKPIASAPYTLDQLAHGSHTIISPSESDLIFHTCGSTGALTAERNYFGTTTLFGSLSHGNYFYSTATESTNASSNRLFINRAFPTNVNFGPLINKMPINLQMVPTFYTMPDDFGLIAVGTDLVTDNDTITASPSEIYTVIRVGTGTSKSAFVCRTT